MVTVHAIEKYRNMIRVTFDDGRIYYLTKNMIQERPLVIGQTVDEMDFDKWILMKQYRFALDKAVRMLSVRACSSGEIAQKLKRGGYSDETIKMVLYKLESNELLNDQDFTDQWVRYRTGQKYGPRRIVQELRIKGISNETAEKAVREINEDEKLEGAIMIARKAAARVKPDDDLRKARRKITAAIVRRGFDWETACQACDRILDSVE